MTMWYGLDQHSDTGLRSDQAETSLLPFKRMQIREIAGLLTRHKTLRSHLYIMGLTDSPLCRRYAAEQETSARVFCQYEPLTTLIRTYLGSCGGGGGG
jgi:hypothetical protein